MAEWIKIECRCGKVGNYLPTISGTTPCDNPRCYNLLKVPKLTKEELEAKMAIDRR